jgi:hypothetical protein
MKKLVVCPDPLFAPNMIWNFVVVTERVNKIGKTDTREHTCVTEEDVKKDIADFLKHEVDNPDAVKGTHYNFGIFVRSPDLENRLFPPPPKPDKIIDHRALFQLRRHKGWEYNIFHVEGDLFAGIIFDRYRRPYYQTNSAPTTEKAIEMARDIIEILSKGQCVAIGFKLDEGKAIREKEEKAQKDAAKTRRGGKK